MPTNYSSMYNRLDQPRITPQRKMNKAFTKDNEGWRESGRYRAPLPAGLKNYIIPARFKRLKDEALRLLDTARPKQVKIIHLCGLAFETPSNLRAGLTTCAAGTIGA